MKYDLLFHIRKESKGYSAQCAEFPSIITQADTKKELVHNMTDAANGYFVAFPEEYEKLQKSMRVKVTISTP